jgi:hypothetical protein
MTANLMNALHWATKGEANGDGLEFSNNQCFVVYRGVLSIKVF